MNDIDRRCLSVIWGLLGIFSILKLTGVVNWPWPWVFSPLWIPIAVYVSALCLASIIAILLEVRGE